MWIFDEFDSNTFLFHLEKKNLVGDKPLSEPMLDYYQLDPYGQTSVKFLHFIKDSAFKNVICKMAAILSRLQWV